MAVQTNLPLPIQKRQARPLLMRWFYLWAKPGWAFLFSFVIYALYAFYRRTPWSISGNPYFNYLADAFLHGQFHLRLMPPSVHDLAFYQGNYYLYWPPFPSILLMPFVAVFGVNFSDILMTIVIGAGNAAIVAALLKAGEVAGLYELSVGRRAILVAFFAIGTVQLAIIPLGQVWFLSQEVAVMCLGLAYLAALKLKGWPAFVLTGLGMACAMATRNHMIVGGIFPAWYLIRQYWPLWKENRKKLFGYVGAALLPPLIIGCLLLAYNVARFGSITEMGYSYHNMAPLFRGDYETYGAFSLHYLPINLYYQYVFYPFPIRDDTPMGGSLFLLSPLFFTAFYTLWARRKEWLTWMLFASVMAINVPILLLMGTGWVTFGPRYTLDFYIPLLLLMAMTLRDVRKNVVFLLFMISFIHYLVGAFILQIYVLAP